MIARTSNSRNQHVSKYNVRVQSKERQPRNITRTETVGFVVIALVILAVILVRWGNVIPWSAR